MLLSSIVKLNSKQIIELIGTTAIVLSLLFVGFQLLLERRVAEAEIYFNRAESQKADTRALIESDAFIQSRVELWENGWRPDYWNDELENYVNEQNYNPTYVQILNLRNFNRILHSDSLYFQYQQGLFSELDWQAARESIKTQLKNPLLRARYLDNAPIRIAQLIDELLNEIKADET